MLAKCELMSKLSSPPTETEHQLPQQLPWRHIREEEYSGAWPADEVFIACTRANTTLVLRLSCSSGSDTLLKGRSGESHVSEFSGFQNRKPEPSEPFSQKPPVEPEPPEPFFRNRNRNHPSLLNCTQTQLEEPF